MSDSAELTKATEDKIVKEIKNLISVLPGDEREKLIENLKAMTIFGGCTLHTCGITQHKHI